MGLSRNTLADRCAAVLRCCGLSPCRGTIATKCRRASVFFTALIGVLAVLGVSVTSRAQDDDVPVKVTTKIEPDHVTIGTPFRYSMRVEATENVELIIPVLAEKIGDFTVTDFGESPVQGEGDAIVHERWYSLVTYETGDQVIPGAPVQYRVAGGDLERVDAPDTLVIVDSLLAKAGEGADLRDVKAPVAVPPDYRPLWWALGALAALLALGAAVYRFFNRARAKAAIPPRPADEVALEALARLRRDGLLEKGEQVEFYVRLSSIIRTYLENRFHLRAPEMTTEEFLQAAQKAPELSQKHRPLLAQFLSDADLVKFARHQPRPEDAERAYEAAREFVTSTGSGAGGAREAA